MFNVIRTGPAPASLAYKRTYSADDVLTQLRAIFYDKCYLCEEKEPYCINIEHFVADRDDDQLKYDWDNLFYVCARCNNLKLAKYNNLLNCTDSTQSIWKMIKILPPRSPGAGIEVTAMDTSDETTQTARLLGEIYNSTDKSINKRITAEYLRKAIYKKIRSFLNKFEIYLNDELPKVSRDDALASMKEMMSAKQEFSAILRWTVIEDPLLNSLLAADIID